VWTYGATLFSHAVTFLSVNYFDQSKMFFFVNVALIASSPFLLVPESDESVQDEEWGEYDEEWSYGDQQG
jgi:hypothetical protein